MLNGLGLESPLPRRETGMGVYEEEGSGGGAGLGSGSTKE